MSRIENTIEIFDESNGLVVSGKALSTIPTTAGKFAIGCKILGADGKEYVNTGTTTVPVWGDEEIDKTVEISLSSSDIKTMFTAPITLVNGVSNKTIILDEVTIKFTPGAVAYTGGGDIMVGTADANCITAIPKALILSVASGTALTSTAKGIDLSVNEATGLDLRLTNADAVFATGVVGGSIVVKYHLV